MDPGRPITWPKFTRFRGDTKRLPFALTWEGKPINYGGEVLIFTLKHDLGDADEAALVQKISTFGGIFTLSTSPWKIEVELVPADDASLEAGVAYQCDVQAQSSGGAVKTVGRCTLKLTDDVTRGTTLAIPTFTTTPPLLVTEDPETMQLVPAAEDLGSGRFLHLLADGTAVHANASTGRPAHGYTREAVLQGQMVALRPDGKLNGLSGLTPGAAYFLSGTTPGIAVLTPPATGLVQRLGAAALADTLLVEIEPPVLIE
jgi:hypothetical protein